MSYLSATDMRGGYGRADILNGCDLSVDRGEIAVIVGPNGAGKSTAMKAVFGMLDLREGTVTLDGHDIAGLTPQDRVRRGMGFVPQTANVFPTMTVEENLQAGAFLRRPGRAALRGALEEVYDWFPRLRDKRATQAGLTSGGEQQMLAIGRALLTRPRLVLLDEPSMGLAPKIVQEIFQIIARLNRDMGIAFIFIAHDLPVVRDFADHVMVMRKGRVVEHGSVRQVFEAPREPYTRALLAAGLDPDPEVQARRREARLAAAL